MEELIRYIFRSLNASEFSIKKMKNILSKQSKFNHTITVFASATIIYIILKERELKCQSKKIEKLIAEMEKIKYAEGD